MSLFGSVRNILRPPPPKETERGFKIPFDLSTEEWTKLKLLLNHEGYPTYVRALDSLVKLKGEQILQTSNADAIHFLRGYVGGLRKAATFVAELKIAEERIAKQKEDAFNLRNDDRSVLYGSPGWRPQRSRGDS